MKKILILVIALMASTAIFAQSHTDTTNLPVYTCTMHPEVTANKPGKCPKCGMDLVKKKFYTCTMHPEIVSDKPGKCPKCGMDLVEKKNAKKGIDPMQKMQMQKKDSSAPKKKVTS